MQELFLHKLAGFLGKKSEQLERIVQKRRDHSYKPEPAPHANAEAKARANPI